MHYDFDPERFIVATRQTEHGYASFLGTQLEEPNFVVRVAERDGEVLGSTYAGVAGYDYMSLRVPAGVLYDIVVDPPRVLDQQGSARQRHRHCALVSCHSERNP